MNIGIFIYDNAEVLDIGGPFEVFSVAKRLFEETWNVFTIADTKHTVYARGNLQIVPHYSLSEHPPIDILCVVGGEHFAMLDNERVLRWLRHCNDNTTITCSVCTGAFILAAANVYQSMPVTTHWEDQDALETMFPQLDVVRDKRWVHHGKFISSGGISAGIDMSLYMVSTLISLDAAKGVARQMEYEWSYSCE